MPSLRFSHKLFRRATQQQWLKYLGHLKNRPVRYLEIGVFEGHSLCWVMQNILLHPDSRAWGVDAWDSALSKVGNPLVMRRGVVEDAYIRALANVAELKMRRDVMNVELVKEPSASWLSRAVTAEETYDLIYIDGSHWLPALWVDTGLAWQVLREGGVLVWDDYDADIRQAVDLFIELVGAEVVWRTHRQIAAKKGLRT